MKLKMLSANFSLQEVFFYCRLKGHFSKYIKSCNFIANMAIAATNNVQNAMNQV